MAYQVAYEVAYQMAQSWPNQGQVEGTSQGQVMSLFVRITSILADKMLSSGDITAALGKEYYSGHLRRIIKMLLSDGIIEYTIPEKPRSRLQKYRLTEKGRQMIVRQQPKGEMTIKKRPSGKTPKRSCPVADVGGTVGES